MDEVNSHWGACCTLTPTPLVQGPFWEIQSGLIRKMKGSGPDCICEALP